MSNAIEQELIRATSFNPERQYRDRQDYLTALVLAVGDIHDDEFQLLSDEAAAWVNDAAKARKARKPIKDFDDESNFDVGSDIEEVGEEPEAEEAPSSTAVPAKSKKSGKTRILRQPKVEHSSEVDEFGVGLHTKGHLAMQMYKNGCTAKDVKEALGGNEFRNLLNKLIEKGFRVEKSQVAGSRGEFIKLYPKGE